MWHADARLLHLLAPALHHCGACPMMYVGPHNDRDIAAGGVFDAGWTGAHGNIQWWMGLLERFGNHPEIIHVRKLTMNVRVSSVQARLITSMASRKRPAFVDQHPQPIKLLTLIATAHPKVQAPTAQILSMAASSATTIGL